MVDPRRLVIDIARSKGYIRSNPENSSNLTFQAQVCSAFVFFTKLYDSTVDLRGSPSEVPP